MRPRSAPRPHKRDGLWYLVRRVPAEFSDLDKRGLVRMSTGIAVADDPRGVRARAAVERLDHDLFDYWAALRSGVDSGARQRLDAAQKRARIRGLEYRTASEIAEGDLRDMLRRLTMLEGSIEDRAEVVAVLGGEEKATIRTSAMIEEYERLVATSLMGMSADQVRKWRNPKLKAVKNLIAVMGEDKDMAALTRSDALALKKWWQDRVLKEGRTIGGANKDIGHLNKMFRTVNEAHDLGLKPVFSGLRLTGEEDNKRTAFTPEHVQAIISGAHLDGLNDEAKAIFWICADTGLRPSEAANLDGSTIHLASDVPYVEVKANGRRLKTRQSQRDVPLAGAALEAAKAFPGGFPRYRNNADSLSALINKVLASHSLLPTPGHSFYSLRHTFKDRMRAARDNTGQRMPYELMLQLMGHKLETADYGAGYSLADKLEWLQRFACVAPAFSHRDITPGSPRRGNHAQKKPLRR